MQPDIAMPKLSCRQATWFFESKRKPDKLKGEIEEGLSQAFSYPAKVGVVPIEELKKIIEANPFKNAPTDYHQYVIFFEGGLEKDFAAEDIDLADEDVKAGKGVAYWKVQKGKNTPKFTRQTASQGQIQKPQH
jgi:uncharacterized protein (DUF1697 family)